MANGVDILFYVEDPGAANFVAALPAALAGLGASSIVLAHPSVAEYLARREVPHEVVAGDADPARLLALHAPRLVACGTAKNPDTLGLSLIAAAQAAALPSAGLVDTRVSASRRFRGRGNDPLGMAPEWLLVPDPWTRQDYRDLGFPSGRILVCGHPHNDFLRARREELDRLDRSALRRRFFPQAPADRPVVLFACERLDHHDDPELSRGPDYALAGWGDAHARVQVVLEEVLDALDAAGLDPWLVLRLHPKNTVEQYARYLPRVRQTSQAEPVLELIRAADRVLGLSSMLLEESLFLGAPTLAVLPRPAERAWLPCIANGLIPSAASREELAARLPAFLEGRLPLPDDRRLEEYFICDATAKAAAALASLAQGGGREGN